MDTPRGWPPCCGKGQGKGKEEKGWILPGDGLHVVEKDKVRERRRRGGYYLGMASMWWKRTR